MCCLPFFPAVVSNASALLIRIPKTSIPGRRKKLSKSPTNDINTEEACSRKKSAEKPSDSLTNNLVIRVCGHRSILNPNPFANMLSMLAVIPAKKAGNINSLIKYTYGERGVKSRLILFIHKNLKIHLNTFPRQELRLIRENMFYLTHNFFNHL